MKKYALPKGFLASGIHSGVKKKRKDLALFYSESPAKAAALFTTNMVKAAPVELAQKTLKKCSTIRAVVVNSGNANCMTGKRGMIDAKKMTKELSKLIGAKKEEVLVSSTGIIGEPMPIKTILKGMKPLVKELSKYGLLDAAHGIMTTDKFLKIASRTFTVGKKKITLTGVAKGAGMIKPNMATMLSYIMTDANIEKGALKKALFMGTNTSFNAITVDGDMSTNDTVVLMANGEAKNPMIKASGKTFNLFQKKLALVSEELAKLIVQDGEGASKLMEVTVKGAKTKKDAEKIAQAIAGSLLVKCAVLGGDPNWGRIASSAGASGVKFNAEKLEIVLDGVTFFKKGKAHKHIDRKKSAVFKKPKVCIEANIHSGKEEATVFSCDISKKYITLNSYYTT